MSSELVFLMMGPPAYKDFSPWGLRLKDYPMHPSTTMHSIGGVYQAVSAYMFRGFDDSGKLMGLAPYGRPGVFNEPMFDMADGRVFLRYDWMRAFRNPSKSRGDFNENFQHFADVACWAQKEVERAIFYVMQSRHEFTPADNLCYAGGVALNAVANGKILENTPYRNFYIQPAAADNGLATGCAYYGWLEVLKGKREPNDGTSCFGVSYDKSRIERALKKYSDAFEIASGDSLERTADLLAQGKTVARYEGRSKFGPRALGNRSILADPRKPEARDHINRNIKFREDFRPFAPSVLAEDVSRYFECRTASPYMLLVVRVRPEYRDLIPAVVHQDGTVRIQTVEQQANPSYYALLQAFKKRTGLGILLNTSLNWRGMLIVETPEQAIEFFATCGLDAMCIDGFIVEKPRNWQRHSLPPLEALQNLISSSSQVPGGLHGIYQLTLEGEQTFTIDLEQKRVSLAHPDRRPDAVINISNREFDTLAASTPEGFRSAVHAHRVFVRGDMNSAARFFEALRVSS
jgi:carbamoyltransferase